MRKRLSITLCIHCLSCLYCVSRLYVLNECDMFQTKFAEIWKHTFRVKKTFFFRKSCRLWYNALKIRWSQTDHRRQQMRFACRVANARIDTQYFIVVTQTHHNVTLYVHRLFWFLSTTLFSLLLSLASPPSFSPNRNVDNIAQNVTDWRPSHRMFQKSFSTRSKRWLLACW